MGCFLFGCGVDCLFFCLVVYSRFFCPFAFLTKTRKRENGEKERQKIEKENERQKNIIFLALIISPYNRGIFTRKTSKIRKENRLSTFSHSHPKIIPNTRQLHSDSLPIIGKMRDFWFYTGKAIKVAKNKNNPLIQGKNTALPKKCKNWHIYMPYKDNILSSLIRRTIFAICIHDAYIASLYRQIYNMPYIIRWHKKLPYIRKLTINALYK